MAVNKDKLATCQIQVEARINLLLDHIQRKT